MRILTAMVLPAVLLAMATAADAAPVLIVNGGILQGATGVVVGSGTYDVSFVDGSCVAVFTGCDQLTDFAFQTSADANLAAQALMDTVFIDGPAGSFDSSPALTRGCGDLRSCVAYTPYSTAAGLVHAIGIENINQQSGDFSSASPGLATGYDLTTNPFVTYAVFTPAAAQPVPEPASLTLLALGGAGLGCYRRRRRR